MVFCFSLTQTKDLKRVRKGVYFWIDFLFWLGFIHIIYTNSKVFNYIFLFKIFSSEAWSIILLAFLLEIPYLVTRSMLIMAKGIFVQSNITFFFLKNVLMVLANIYKLYSLRNEYIESVGKLLLETNRNNNHKIIKNKKIPIVQIIK